LLKAAAKVSTAKSKDAAWRLLRQFQKGAEHGTKRLTKLDRSC
jgi:hypothetical protein